MVASQIMEKLEQMESIDFKKITEEVVSVLSNMPLKKETGMRYRRYLVDTPISYALIKSLLVFGVWEKSLRLLNGNGGEFGPLAIEEVIASLKRKGKLKGEIRFKKNSFTIKMENSQYRIYKYPDYPVNHNVLACPWPCPSEMGKYLIPFVGEPLVDFMIRFDEELPNIVSHVSTVLEVIRARKMEETKSKMEKQLKDNLIQSLIDQYLKPLGVTAFFSVNTDDMVSLDLQKVMTSHIEIPLDQIVDKLKDTAGITDSLAVVKTKNRVVYEELYDDLDDDLDDDVTSDVIIY